MWIVAEDSVTPKKPGSDGEDRLAVRRDRDGTLVAAAVIDGATDKSGRDYGGLTGGARAADCLVEAISTLPLSESLTAEEGVAHFTESMARLRKEWGIAGDDLLAPNASIALILPQLGQIWRVGDVHVSLRTKEGDYQDFPAVKHIDRINAAFRAAYWQCRLAQGDSPADIMGPDGKDTGREVTMPVLTNQDALANIDDDNPLGFGIIDGRSVPSRYVTTIPIPNGAQEIIVASDGYLSAAPSLEEANRALATVLENDPHLIGAHASTKGLTPGNRSYDDCAYMKLVPLSAFAMR